MIKEVAPRPHNSGHLTIEGCESSQFEQHVRAVCNLRLGSTRLRSQAAAMVNLLGDLWEEGEPDWNALCAHPSSKLHLYGKHEARVGRKMGHVTSLADDIETARQASLSARESLTSR